MSYYVAIKFHWQGFNRDKLFNFIKDYNKPQNDNKIFLGKKDHTNNVLLIKINDPDWNPEHAVVTRIKDTKFASTMWLLSKTLSASMEMDTSDDFSDVKFDADGYVDFAKRVMQNNKVENASNTFEMISAAITDFLLATHDCAAYKLNMFINLIVEERKELYNRYKDIFSYSFKLVNLPDYKYNWEEKFKEFEENEDAYIEFFDSLFASMWF